MVTMQLRFYVHEELIYAWVDQRRSVPVQAVRGARSMRQQRVAEVKRVPGSLSRFNGRGPAGANIICRTPYAHSPAVTESAQSSALLIAHTLADEGGLHAWSSEHFTMAKHLTVTTNYARYVLLILLGVYGERDDEDFVPLPPPAPIFCFLVSHIPWVTTAAVCGEETGRGSTEVTVASIETDRCLFCSTTCSPMWL